jgi:cbb3-type cytochrome oxidase subunit 3
MPSPDVAILLYGGALSAVFLAIIVYYYRKKRRPRVEAPKYKMMEDDD